MKEKSLTIFVLVGGLGKTLIYSKIKPISNSKLVKKVFIFSRGKGLEIEKSEYILIPGFVSRIRPNFLKSLFRTLVEFGQIFLYAIRYRPNLINGIYTIPQGLYSVIISKLLGIKSIVSIIGEEEELHKKGRKFPKLGLLINNFIFKESSFITTKGNKTRKYLLEKTISPQKVGIFNGSISLENNSGNKNYVRDIDLLFVGQFSELKGPDRVLKIALNLLRRFPNLRVVFLGDGKLFNDIKSFVYENKLETKLYLKGYVDNVQEYYAKAKILLVTSRCEGLSTSMLEAMYCGCVPIVSDVGNLTDAAHHNVNSMVVEDYLDVSLFSNYAEELLLNRDKWNKLSINAISTVILNYSLKKQTQIFENILEKI